MDIIDYAMARRLLAAIPHLHDAVATFSNDHISRTFPAAPMAAEIDAFRDQEIIRTAYSQGSILVEVAADHLIAFSKTLTEPVEAFAPWVSVRAVMESSALSAWFMDPAITALERARRSLAFRYEGLIEQSKFLRASKCAQADPDTVMQRVDDLEASANRLGIPKLRGKDHKRSGIGMRMPSVTELIGQIHDDEAGYRLASAVTHGHHWAVQQMGYTFYEPDDGKSDYVRLRKHISPAAIGYLAVRTVRSFVKPVWYKSRQHGWDMERLAGILEATYDSMSIVDRVRFWRSIPASSCS